MKYLCRNIQRQINAETNLDIDRHRAPTRSLSLKAHRQQDLANSSISYTSIAFGPGGRTCAMNPKIPIIASIASHERRMGTTTGSWVMIILTYSSALVRYFHHRERRRRGRANAPSDSCNDAHRREERQRVQGVCALANRA